MRARSARAAGAALYQYVTAWLREHGLPSAQIGGTVRGYHARTHEQVAAMRLGAAARRRPG
jgi:hypothetical protein